MFPGHVRCIDEDPALTMTATAAGQPDGRMVARMGKVWDPGWPAGSPVCERQPPSGRCGKGTGKYMTHMAEVVQGNVRPKREDHYKKSDADRL